MALTTQQIANLNSLNQKISGGYKATSTDLANLDYAKKQGYSYNPVPTGATKILNPAGLQGLTESQIFRSGQDIYKLPSAISSDMITGGTAPSVPLVEQTQSLTQSVPDMLNTSNKGLQEIIKQQQTASRSEAKIDPITQRVSDLTAEFQAKPQDFQTELGKYGFNQNVDKLQNLMPQIAALETQFAKSQEDLLNTPGRTRIIGGTADRLQRQSAIELAGLSAMAQAYQGNIEMAQSIATQMTNLKYEPIQMEIDNQKFQLEQVYDQLDREDKRKADSLTEIIKQRERLITEEKDAQNKINEVMLSAAKGGASQALLERVMKATTYGEAVSIAKDYLKEKTTTDDDGVNPVDLQFTDLNELPQNVVEGTPGWANVLISQASKDYGVPASLVSAIIKQESGFNPDAKNVNDKERSYGLGQINLNAHPQITEKQAKDPSFAVNFVAQRLKSMIDKYGLYEGIQAYNTPGAIGSDQLIRYANNVLSMVGVNATPTPTPETEVSDFDYGRSIIEANPKASKAELKTALMENTKLNVSQINAVLDEYYNDADAGSDTTEKTEEKERGLFGRVWDAFWNK